MVIDLFFSDNNTNKKSANVSTDASRMINKDWAAQVRRAISLVFLSFFFLLSFNKKVTPALPCRRPHLRPATMEVSMPQFPVLERRTFLYLTPLARVFL